MARPFLIALAAVIANSDPLCAQQPNRPNE